MDLVNARVRVGVAMYSSHDLVNVRVRVGLPYPVFLCLYYYGDSQATFIFHGERVSTMVTVYSWLITHEKDL